MSEHPLDLSARLIDTGVVDTPPNRITQELSELADGVALIESFSHVAAVDTGEGLVTFDASSAASGRAVVESLRKWSDDPVHSIVYTHGHLDHVGGSRAFAADAERRGRPLPRVFGHEAVQDDSIDTNRPLATTRSSIFVSSEAVLGLPAMATNGPSFLREPCHQTLPMMPATPRPSATSPSSSNTARARPTTTPGPGSQNTR